jgi:hypothetical protein
MISLNRLTAAIVTTAIICLLWVNFSSAQPQIELQEINEYLELPFDFRNNYSVFYEVNGNLLVSFYEDDHSSVIDLDFITGEYQYLIKNRTSPFVFTLDENNLIYRAGYKPPSTPVVISNRRKPKRAIKKRLKDAVIGGFVDRDVLTLIQQNKENIYGSSFDIKNFRLINEKPIEGNNYICAESGKVYSFLCNQNDHILFIYDYSMNEYARVDVETSANQKNCPGYKFGVIGKYVGDNTIIIRTREKLYAVDTKRDVVKAQIELDYSYDNFAYYEGFVFVTNSTQKRLEVYSATSGKIVATFPITAYRVFIKNNILLVVPPSNKPIENIKRYKIVKSIDH